MILRPTWTHRPDQPRGSNKRMLVITPNLTPRQIMRFLLHRQEQPDVRVFLYFVFLLFAKSNNATVPIKIIKTTRRQNKSAVETEVENPHASRPFSEGPGGGRGRRADTGRGACWGRRGLGKTRCPDRGDARERAAASRDWGSRGSAPWPPRPRHPPGSVSRGFEPSAGSNVVAAE